MSLVQVFLSPGAHVVAVDDQWAYLWTTTTTTTTEEEEVVGGNLPVLWIYRAARVCGAFYNCHNSWSTFPPAKRNWTFSWVWSRGPFPPRWKPRSALPSTGSSGQSRAPAGSPKPPQSRRRAVWAVRADRSNLWKRPATQRWRTPVSEHCAWVWEWGWAWADPRIPTRITTCPPFASGAGPLPIARTAKPKNPRGNTMPAATRASICCSPSFSSAGRTSERRKHILCWTGDWWTGRSPTRKSANPTASHFASPWKRGKTPRRPRRRRRTGQTPWAVSNWGRLRCKTCTRWTKSPCDGPVWEGWRSSSHSRSWSPLSCLHFQLRRGALFYCAKPLRPPVQPWLDSGSSYSCPEKVPPSLLIFFTPY